MTVPSISENTQVKRCSRCKEEKPFEAFARNRTTRDGRQYRCRECQRIERAPKREEAAARSREWYAANKERAAASSREYREDHRDETATRMHSYYEQNRDRIKARIRARERRLRDAGRRARELRAALLAGFGLKDCRSCGAVLPRFRFPRARGTQDGLYTYCRACSVEKARQWAQANPEKAAAQRAKWEAENPERAAMNKRRVKALRRAREEGQFVEHIEPLVVLELDDGVCGICGEDVDPFRFEVDHVVPIARGGLHGYANVQTAHPECNRRKAARLVEAA